jgi:multidrug resistance efflux pump
MIAFLIIVYTGLVLVLFKVLRIRPTAYIIASILVAGVLMIGAVVVVWALSAPITDKLVTSQYVVQLVPYVKGQVKAVYAQANQPMKKGDVLLEIDPAPYQFTVSQVEAQLNAAKANVKQAEAGLEAAEANAQKAKDGVAQAQAAVDQANAAVASARATLAKTKAADDLAKTQEQIALNIQHQNVAAISRLNVAKATQERQEADAAVQQAEAGVTQAQAAARQAVSGLAAAQSAVQQAEAAAQQAAFAVQVAQSNVLAVEAQLGDARFNLAQCKMMAPTDGYVVNWQVQVGTMLVSLPLAPAGTFVNTEDIAVAAVYPQNWLAHVEPGDDVEMVLNPYPGRLFLGKVDYVIPATGGGQFTTSGTIVNAARVGSDGLYAVRINFTDAAVARSLSLGSGGSAAIYTKSGKPTHIISKVTIRMKKWLLYVMPSAEKPPS